MAITEDVFSSETAPYRYLEEVPAGTKMTVYTRVKSAGARTNELAVLVKEEGYGDWQVVSRPKTSDPSVLPETWSAHPGVISARTLADTFSADSNLWAAVKRGATR